MQLTDSVYAFPLDVTVGGRTLTVHPVGIETARGLLLVDAGAPGTLDALADALADEGFALADVDYLLLTNQDADHAGGAAAVVEQSDATVLAHRADAPAICGETEPLEAGGTRYPPVNVDLRLAGDEVVPSNAGPVEVVTTPGHTPGHISLHVPDARLLLAGDALTVEEGDGLAGPRERSTLDVDTALDSAYALSTLDYDRTLCYHGGLLDEGADAVAELVEERRASASGVETATGSGRRFLRREVDSVDVGLGRFVLDAGERHGSKRGGDTAHRHSDQEELYLVLDGSGTAKIDDQTFAIATGDALRVPRYCYRAFEADDHLDFVAAGAPVDGDEPRIVDDFW